MAFVFDKTYSSSPVACSKVHAIKAVGQCIVVGVKHATVVGGYFSDDFIFSFLVVLFSLWYVPIA